MADAFLNPENISSLVDANIISVLAVASVSFGAAGNPNNEMGVESTYPITLI